MKDFSDRNFPVKCNGFSSGMSAVIGSDAAFCCASGASGSDAASSGGGGAASAAELLSLSLSFRRFDIFLDAVVQVNHVFDDRNTLVATVEWSATAGLWGLILDDAHFCFVLLFYVMLYSGKLVLLLLCYCNCC